MPPIQTLPFTRNLFSFPLTTTPLSEASVGETFLIGIEASKHVIYFVAGRLKCGVSLFLVVWDSLSPTSCIQRYHVMTKYFYN